MSTYVMSDIHGQYDKFMDILKKIDLKDEDTLYVLGDVLDRGPHPIKVLLKLMEMPNAICLTGNHEYMAVECLSFLLTEVTDRALDELDVKTLGNLVTWQYNGANSTIDEFRELSREMQDEVIEFIKDFSIYEEVRVNGQDYLMVHAGLGNFEPSKDIEDYSLKDIIWERAEYEKKYYDDKIVITGHTPTQMIEGNPNPGYIYKKNNHMAIDCGAYLEDGRLAAVCLETGEEFYS
ncbi:MAG: serine/threonine protein phosphatase [Lachnospiraceae bacterium]|nr:serine/threonine protein phosphatase [Lachnospiraceae bacterium]